MPTKKPDGGPAFPSAAPVPIVDGNGKMIRMEFRDPESFLPGMSLRDWFAGQVLAGLMASRSPLDAPIDRARAAYRTADAMLAEREKGA